MSKVDFRCVKCDLLLAREEILSGELEIRCRNCKTFNIIRADGVDRVQGAIDKGSDLIDNFNRNFS